MKKHLLTILFGLGLLICLVAIPFAIHAQVWWVLGSLAVNAGICGYEFVKRLRRRAAPTTSTTYLQGANAMLSMSAATMHSAVNSLQQAQQANHEAQQAAFYQQLQSTAAAQFGQIGAASTVDYPETFYKRRMWAALKNALEGRSFTLTSVGMSEELDAVMSKAEAAAVEAINKHYAPPAPVPEPEPFVYQEPGELEGGRAA